MAKPPYTPTKKHIKTVETLAGNGCTENEIAKALGISRTTFFKNKRTFADAIKRGRENFWDDTVLEDIESIGLKRLVLGHHYTETTYDQKVDMYGVKHDTIKKVHKYVMPNPASVFFALCNQKPDRWKNINEPSSGPRITKDLVGDIAAGLTTLDASTVPLPPKPPDPISPGPPVPNTQRRSPVKKNSTGKKAPILRGDRKRKP